MFFHSSLTVHFFFFFLKPFFCILHTFIPGFSFCNFKAAAKKRTTNSCTRVLVQVHQTDRSLLPRPLSKRGKKKWVRREPSRLSSFRCSLFFLLLFCSRRKNRLVNGQPETFPHPAVGVHLSGPADEWRDGQVDVVPVAQSNRDARQPLAVGFWVSG